MVEHVDADVSKPWRDLDQFGLL